MNHDTHCGVREYVWVTDQEESGLVEETATRFYTVQTPGGEFRRNSATLKPKQFVLRTNMESDVTPRKSENLPVQVEPESTTNQSPIGHQTRSRNYRPPKPPEQFDNSWT